MKMGYFPLDAGQWINQSQPQKTPGLLISHDVPRCG